jgi:hypothetical protein
LGNTIVDFSFAWTGLDTIPIYNGEVRGCDGLPEGDVIQGCWDGVLRGFFVVDLVESGITDDGP